MKKQDLIRVLKGPVISEKSSSAAESNNQVVFRVKSAANKAQIKKAVETLFEVKVASVNVLNVKGKDKRFGRFVGQKSDWKKAYVKLQPGFSIDLSAA
ncbi:50S ribosomal protein L23 [Methylococcus sp. EFPC2]|uniref:50S ribosomal protein L23 n=1 Tax=Methylococcus sp. EFPC2 TaxID=2812648 RepID=UPI001967B0F0|nr:50S ribosomal protein L23 [Methylococcus sp. EFPC2]QSA95962.1 50S ribosomal protein L23 [Methylococcus sp. EFPC2]